MGSFECRDNVGLLIENFREAKKNQQGKYDLLLCNDLTENVFLYGSVIETYRLWMRLSVSLFPRLSLIIQWFSMLSRRSQKKIVSLESSPSIGSQLSINHLIGVSATTSLSIRLIPLVMLLLWVWTIGLVLDSVKPLSTSLLKRVLLIPTMVWSCQGLLENRHWTICRVEGSLSHIRRNGWKSQAKIQHPPSPTGRISFLVSFMDRPSSHCPPPSRPLLSVLEQEIVF